MTKSKAAENKKRGSTFEALIKQSSEEQGLIVTRLKDSPHLTTRIMMLEQQLRAAGKFIQPGPMTGQKNPCDFIISGSGLTVYYEAKSTVSELRFASIKQWMKPDDKKRPCINDYWHPDEMVLSGLIVQFCDVAKTLFIPLPEIALLWRERKTGFDYDRARNFGVEIGSFIPEGKRTKRLDMRKLHNTLVGRLSK